MRYGHLLAGILFLIFLFCFALFLLSSPGDSGKIGVKTSASTSTKANVSYSSRDASSTLSSTSAYSAPTSQRVSYTDNGFDPASVSIAPHMTVTFENHSSSSFLPFSAPTAINPSSGGCGSALGICVPVTAGGSVTLRFDNIGEWLYYNSLNQSHTGAILVK